MTGPAVLEQGDPVVAAVKLMKAHGVPLDEIEAYVAKKRGSATPTGHNGTPFVDAKPEEDPSYAEQALGGIASLVKDIPGAEAAQAGVRSLVRGQPYRTALEDIQGAEESAPASVRLFNRAAGGSIAALATPGAPALQAARFGILSGLGQSNPDATVKNRLDDAAVRGAIDAATAGLVQNAPAIGRGAGRAAGAVLHPRRTLAGLIRGGASEAASGAEGVADEAAPVLSTLGRNRGEPLPLFRGEPLKLVSDAEPAVPNAAPDQRLIDLFSDEAKAADAARAPKFPPDRSRTKAQFEYFAQRMADAKNAGRIP